MPVEWEKDDAGRLEARVHGAPPTAAEVSLIASAAPTSVLFAKGSVAREGADVSWLAEVPTVDLVWIGADAKCPDIGTISLSARRALLVEPLVKNSLDPALFRHTERLHLGHAGAIAGGVTGLDSVRHLEVGRVGGEHISVGDRCACLTYLKVRGKRQRAVIAWADPPLLLTSIQANDLRLASLEGVAAVQGLRDVAVYNGSVLAAEEPLDLAPLDECSELRMVHLAENLPQKGVDGLVGAVESVTVHVARGFHDGTAGHARVHEYAVRAKVVKPEGRVP